MNPSTCPVCQSSLTSDQALPCIDHLVTKELFHVVFCPVCRLGITTEPPEQLDKYYDSTEYISHNTKSKNILTRAYRIARHINNQSKHKLITKSFPSEHSKLSLLDIGCGIGSFLHHCQNKGLKVTGVEPSTVARTQALTITPNIFTQLSDIKQDTFDIITLWHVLEHLPDLTQNIKNIKSKLKPKGRLYIAVPNYLSNDAQHYRSNWAAYDVPRHLWHFTPTTMNTLAKSNNFIIQAIHPMKMDSYYVSLLSEKNSSLKSPLARFLRALSIGYTSNRLARKTGNYSSLIYEMTHA